MSRRLTKQSKLHVRPAETQISLDIRWPPEKKFPIKCIAKTLMRLGAQVILFVLSCCGSYNRRVIFQAGRGKQKIQIYV